MLDKLAEVSPRKSRARGDNFNLFSPDGLHEHAESFPLEEAM
jgi:hypothetical protein